MQANFPWVGFSHCSPARESRDMIAIAFGPVPALPSTATRADSGVDSEPTRPYFFSAFFSPADLFSLAAEAGAVDGAGAAAGGGAGSKSSSDF